MEKKRVVMKAMILAAGFGTRLRPLSLGLPKALMPVGNVPVIDRVIESLKVHGVTEIVVNAHHHHQQLARHLNSGFSFGVLVQVLVERVILGTGGGIRNTEGFWDADPFIVINSDVLTDINLSEAYEYHLSHGSLATLILHERDPFNQVQVDSNSDILGFGDKSSPGRLAFTGIHIIDPDLLAHIPRAVFSDIIDCYRDLIRSGKPIKAHIVRGHYWCDIGTVESYVLANKECLRENYFLLGNPVQIHDSVRLEEWAVVGDNVRIEEGVEIRRSVLWENVTVRKGRKIVDSIVTSWNDVDRDIIHEVY